MNGQTQSIAGGRKVLSSTPFFFASNSVYSPPQQNEKIAEQDSQIKMLQSQLKDCLTREEKLTEKHEKHMEREDKVLQKLDEISSRQASTEKGLLLQRSSTVGNAILNQSAKCVKDDIIDYVSQNPPNRAFRNQFAWNSTEVSEPLLNLATLLQGST